jgi:hypothetical protein
MTAAKVVLDICGERQSHGRLKGLHGRLIPGDDDLDTAVGQVAA